MKVLTVLGARPQFIKAATVSRQFKSIGVEEVILHTGQHFDHNMSQVFFEEMDIPKPYYNLDIHGLSHGAMTGRMLEGIEKIILKEKPNLVLVYGDTNSTLAGALASQKIDVPVAHVEAGLRSFNMKMPEEINRIITDRISKYLFCPTQLSIQNLVAEGFKKFDCYIENVGDVMLDASKYYGSFSSEKSSIISRLKLNSNFVIATVHRQENTDDARKLKNIIEAFNDIHQEVQVVVPIHPRTKEIIEKLGINVKFIHFPPVGYFDMIEMLKNCSLVLTDSGGLQKEAFFFEKGCVTLRKETEWIELIENGFNILADADRVDIFKAWKYMINKKFDFSVNLYGNGEASERIARFISKI